MIIRLRVKRFHEAKCLTGLSFTMVGLFVVVILGAYKVMVINKVKSKRSNEANC